MVKVRAKQADHPGSQSLPPKGRDNLHMVDTNTGGGYGGGETGAGGKAKAVRGNRAKIICVKKARAAPEIKAGKMTVSIYEKEAPKSVRSKYIVWRKNMITEIFRSFFPGESVGKHLLHYILPAGKFRTQGTQSSQGIGTVSGNRK